MQKRKDALLKQLEVADESPALLHPRMADLYRSKVEEFASALKREDTRLEASEMLRGLVDVLVPEERPAAFARWRRLALRRAKAPDRAQRESGGRNWRRNPFAKRPDEPTRSGQREPETPSV